MLENKREQYGANTWTAPGILAMLACMLLAYSTFEHAT